MPVSIPPHLLETVQHFSRNMGHARLLLALGVTFITIRCLVEIPQAVSAVHIVSIRGSEVLPSCSPPFCSAVQCGAVRANDPVAASIYSAACIGNAPKAGSIMFDRRICGLARKLSKPGNCVRLDFLGRGIFGIQGVIRSPLFSLPPSRCLNVLKAWAISILPSHTAFAPQHEPTLLELFLQRGAPQTIPSPCCCFLARLCLALP